MDEEQKLTAGPSSGGHVPATRPESWRASARSRRTRGNPKRSRRPPTPWRQSLFGPSPSVFAHVIARHERIIGIAVWFLNYSTWTGRAGIYLEDLFVYSDERGRGYGKALLRALAQLCAERGYRRLEWSVLDWNQPAIGFYRSIGAVGMDEWTVQRLSGDALTRLAAG